MEEFIRLYDGLENLNNNNPAKVMADVFDFPNLIKIKLLASKMSDSIKKTNGDINSSVAIMLKALKATTASTKLLDKGSMIDMFKCILNVDATTSAKDVESSILSVLCGESQYISKGLLEIRYNEEGVLQACQVDTANDYVLNSKITVNKCSNFTALKNTLLKIIHVLSQASDERKRFVALIYAIYLKVLSEVESLCDDDKNYTIMVNKGKLEIEKAMKGLTYTKEIKQINDNEIVFNASIIYKD